MKKLIIAEVNSFRAEVRAQARAAGQIRRQERSVGIVYLFFSYKFINVCSNSLPIPSRDEILSSPVQEYGPHHGATSGFTSVQSGARPPSPIMDDPSEELERELAGTHLGAGRR